MGSKLRRQLREALPPEIKGLPRAVALEIADDARWDDSRRYDPDGGRHSRATLADLVRWTAAKNERVIRDALRTLALAGWEFRVPFGKGADGRLLYAVPGRAAEFRVPDFDPGETVVTVSPPSQETVVTAYEAATTVEETVTTAYEAATAVTEAVVTGPPSPVPRTSHQDSPSSPAEPDDTEPPAAPDVTEGGGGGGGSDLRSTAEDIAARLDYFGQIPDKQQQERITAALVAVLGMGWPVETLAAYLNPGSFRPDNPAAFYLAKLTTKLPAIIPPLPASQAPAGGVFGPIPGAAAFEAATVASVFSTTRQAGPAVGAHRPYSNDVWSRPATPAETAGIPWCGDVECEPIGRMRERIDDNGLKHDEQCEKCHPNYHWGAA